MVELVRTGRTPQELAREFEPTAQTIRNWVAKAGTHSKRVCALRASRRYGRLTRTGRPVFDAGAVKGAERLDGKFVVRSNDDSLSAVDMALGYKQLQRVEQAWRELKGGLHPVYHRVAHRIHAHIALSVMELLLERMAEQVCGDTWRNIRDDLKQIQLVQLSGPNGRLWQVTEPREGARKRLKALRIKAPPTLLKLA